MVSSLVLIVAAMAAATERCDVNVLPAESKQIADPITGVELTFLTTAPGKDVHTYIYQEEWLADGSAILFNSDRNHGGAMAYLTRTGELACLATPKGILTTPLASVKRPVFFARRGREVVEATIAPTYSEDPKTKPSAVRLDLRVLCTLPESKSGSYLTENPDGTKLTLGLAEIGNENRSAILVIDIASGAISEVCNFPDPMALTYHVQWSWGDPNLILFAGREQRLMAVDLRDGKPRNLYKQREDEMVTHETSWVNNQVMFCGGTHPKPAEDAHVKLLDLTTGVVRVVGPGAWWQGASASELAKVNWWHSSGSRDGRWLAADNWHGDIMLWEGKTTRPRLLTSGHRTYGKGEHPHVAWDQAGKAVIFTSEMLGDPNVCVATIPEAWQAANP